MNDLSIIGKAVDKVGDPLEALHEETQAIVQALVEFGKIYQTYGIDGFTPKGINKRQGKKGPRRRNRRR